MTKTFDELDAKVTLQAAEIARLTDREGTVRGQIEDLQARVNENDTKLRIDWQHKFDALEKECIYEHCDPLHNEVKALEARVKELEGKAKSGHDIVEHLRNVNEQERSIRADERERVAAYCESRGFVDTVRVIRTMGDKVKS